MTAIEALEFPTAFTLRTLTVLSWPLVSPLIKNVVFVPEVLTQFPEEFSSYSISEIAELFAAPSSTVRFRAPDPAKAAPVTAGTLGTLAMIKVEGEEATTEPTLLVAVAAKTR